jgi:hypothetical protein
MSQAGEAGVKMSDIKTDFDYPAPIDPSYSKRKLVRPWADREEMPKGATKTSTGVVWTRMEQNMFELQVVAAENGTHERGDQFKASPYPQ